MSRHDADSLIVFHEDHTRNVGVDYRTPADAMIEAEENSGDDSETLTLAGISNVPKDALKILLQFILPKNCRPGLFWQLALKRLVVIAHQADIDGIGHMSQTELAHEIGSNRASLNFHVGCVAKELGFETVRGGKSASAREIYRAARIRSHARLTETS